MKFNKDSALGLNARVSDRVPMKVVFATIDSCVDFGGVTSWLRRLLPRLIAAGFDVEVHVSAIGGRPGANCAWFEKQGIPFRWKPWETDTKVAVRNCLRLIQKSQPDVYVPNCIIPAYYAAGCIQNQGVHSVGVLHSDDPFYWGIVDEFISGEAPFRLSAVVTVSRFLEEAVANAARKSKVILRRIGCGVPITDEMAKPPHGVFRLVYVGRLVEEQKRVSEVTRALCTVIAQTPGMEAWIVGEGEARANVEGIIQASGIDPQRIRLLGRVEVSGIYSILVNCHALVLLSDYEGLPLSVLEAMAAGVVPICLDMRSGIREAIRPGINGLIVNDRNGGFCSAVQTLQRDPAFWSKLSANARQTVREAFSADACAASWIELLHSFQKSQRTGPVRSPFSLRLPPINPKLAGYDERPTILTKGLRVFRKPLGKIWRRGKKLFNGTSSTERTHKTGANPIL